MAAEKKPQDHKEKAPKVKVVDGGREIKIRGLTVFVADDALNDYELLEDAASGEVSRVASVVERLLGKEATTVVKDALRNPVTGRVPAQGPGSMTEFIGDLFGAINPN